MGEMIRIILSIVWLVAVAVFLVLNAGASAPINIFGFKVDAPIAALAIASFVLGIVYSFVYYLAHLVDKGRRRRLSDRRQKLQSQEADLRNREKELEGRERATAPEAASPPRGLFGRSRRRSAVHSPK
jgi:uncharacterized integral membrane protein